MAIDWSKMNQNSTKINKANLPIDIILGDQVFLKALFGSTPISMIFYDKDGRVIFVNDFYSKVTGHSLENKLGKKLIDPGEITNHPTKDKWFESKIHNAIHKKMAFETRGFYYKSRITGREWYLDITIMPIICSHDNVLGAYSFAQDVTEDIRNKQKIEKMNSSLEERIEQKITRIKNKNKKIQSLLQEKNIFLRNIAHEFRTMLTIIQTSLELRKDISDNKTIAELETNIVSEIKLMDKLISNMVFVSHTMKDIEEPTEKFNLCKLVQKVLSELSILAQKKGTKIKIECLAQDIIIEAKMTQIASVVKNIIENSIKYGRNNGLVNIKIAQDKKTVIEISDNGRGINAKEQQKIFLPFYRVKDNGSNIKGSGLGLAICKKVVESHNGSLSVSSSLGKGTVFKIVLPN